MQDGTHAVDVSGQWVLDLERRQAGRQQGTGTLRFFSVTRMGSRFRGHRVCKLTARFASCCPTAEAEALQGLAEGLTSQSRSSRQS